MLMLRCDVLNNYGMRSRANEQNSNEYHERPNRYQWKAWITTFRTLILEIKVEFIIGNRRVTVVAEQFVRTMWTLNNLYVQYVHIGCLVDIDVDAYKRNNK